MRGDPFKLLLALMAAAFVLAPFFSGAPVVITLSRIAIEITIIVAVAKLNASRRLLAFVIAVAVTNEATLWLSLESPGRAAVLVSEISGLVFIATTFSVIARNAWRESTVDASLIAAGIAAYFLLGYFWGAAFSLLEFLQPGSFAGACAAEGMQVDCVPARAHFPRLNYLSFVTLTTLGYGDILPLTRHAEGFSTMASVTGQLYIAILIGRIISISVKPARV